MQTAIGLPVQEPRLPARYFFDPLPRGTCFPPRVIEECLAIPGVRMAKNGWTLNAPTNCAWLLERLLRERGVPYNGWSYRVSPMRWPATLSQIHELRAVDPHTGIELERFVNAYQRRESFRNLQKPAVLFRHPTGSGKSLTSMIWALSQPGQIVVVTGARGRNQWRDQIRRYATVEPFVVGGLGLSGEREFSIAQGLVRTQAEELRKTLMAKRIGKGLSCSCNALHPTVFVKRKNSNGSYDLIGRATLPVGQHVLNTPNGELAIEVKPLSIPKEARIIVVSWEVLSHHVKMLAAIRPMTLILDEPWRAKAHRKTAMLPASEESRDPDTTLLGDGRWVKFVDLENLASATFALAKASKRRCLLTATLVKDRICDAWAQLNYAEPWCWGAYWPWAVRYAGAVRTLYGWNDKSDTHLDELMQRMAFIDSYVTREEANINLPPLRIETIYLPPDAQGAPDPEIEAEIRAAHGKPQTIIDAGLAVACSRKRKAVAEEAAEAANNGAKVTIFTGRHRDVDALAIMLKRLLSKKVTVWATDGRTPVDRRHKIIQEYMETPTHGVLLAVGYALGDQIDLHETDLFILAQLPWTGAELIQWIGRFHRQGGTRPCLGKLMVAEGTADDRVITILLSKLPVLERIGTEGVAGLDVGLRGDETALLAELCAGIVASGETGAGENP